MSDRKTKFLGYSVVAMLFVGLILAATPFVASLKPSARADSLAGKFRIDVSDFQPNTYQLVQIEPSKLEVTDQSTTYKSGRAWLVIRDHAGEFVVFWVPTWEDSIPMPRHVWGQHEGYCFDLGPAPGSELINESTIIQCREADRNTDWFSNYWFWTIDGENVSGELPDLIRVRSVAVGKTLAIGSHWIG